jgi:hypothetical protein
MRSTKNRPAIDALDKPDLDNRLTHGDEVVSLTRRPSFTPRNILGTHFY